MMSEEASDIVATGIPYLGFSYELMLTQDIAHDLTHSYLPSFFFYPSFQTLINLQLHLQTETFYSLDYY